MLDRSHLEYACICIQVNVDDEIDEIVLVDIADDFIVEILLLSHGFQRSVLSANILVMLVMRI